MRILLVEDDPQLGPTLARGLREQSYAVDLATAGNDAIYRAAINEYDIIVLDYMIPEVDGLGVAREIRKRGRSKPILFLTARDALAGAPPRSRCSSPACAPTPAAPRPCYPPSSPSATSRSTRGGTA